MLPLQNMLVLDFSQYLAGPSAALRLADLGARVIKLERKGHGDGCRNISQANLWIGGDSVLFQTINRNKDSYAVDLKDPEDLEKVKKLIAKADVMIENFRPGIMARLGLDYESVKQLNPSIVYGTVTGYGKEGPWKEKPGQDLLIQSLTGLAHLNGNADQPPMPFGLSLPDTLTGAHLVQGILACLVRRGITREGGYVEVSLMESALDFQFEVLTTYLNDGNQLPKRCVVNNANAYLAAPYGIYETADGHLALAMGSILVLADLLECEQLKIYQDPDDWFNKRDEIKLVLVDHLKTRKTNEWLSRLEPADYWCAAVMNWDELTAHDAFKQLDMTLNIVRADGSSITTTGCPITIDGRRPKAPKPAPRLGEQSLAIEAEFEL